MRINREGWLLIVVLVFAAVLLAVSAWKGERWAAVLLAVFLVANQVLHQITRGLLRSAFRLNDEIMKIWTRDRDYANRVTDDYVVVLGLLLEHEPRSAQKYIDRLDEATRERDPELVQEMSEQAAMN